MANQYREIDKDELINLAEEYLTECETSVKELLANTGKAVEISDRRIPTFKYFILIWLKNKEFDFYSRQHVYKIMENEEHPLCDTIKNVRAYFDALAEDVVANEGKGIFYAKNRLGMSDRRDLRVNGELNHKITGMNIE